MRGQISFVIEKWVFFFVVVVRTITLMKCHIVSDSLFVARSPS